MSETAPEIGSAPAPDLWFSFVRTHRLMIREIERRLAAANLPVYAWYDVLWGLESGPTVRAACTNWPTRWPSNATTSRAW